MMAKGNLYVVYRLIVINSETLKHTKFCVKIRGCIQKFPD